HDTKNGTGGLGSAYPNSKLKGSHFTDGTAHTLGFAEVKAWQPYFRNKGNSTVPAIPNATADICSLGGPDFKIDSGHTEWVDGRAHQIGFTTTFPPNTVVACEQDGVVYDV